MVVVVRWSWWLSGDGVGGNEREESENVNDKRNGVLGAINNCFGKKKTKEESIFWWTNLQKTYFNNYFEFFVGYIRCKPPHNFFLLMLAKF